jgi:23S rRNA pseudouridine2605 synthase
MATERLQKLIARAGLASRRTAEAFILSGRVRVNGRVVTTPGMRADPVLDRIHVDDTLVRLPRTYVYVMLHKPRATVTTAADPQGRRTVRSLVRAIQARLFPVGRLPYDVQGLLLLTNDGDFADTVLRAHLPQTFWLKVKCRLTKEEEAKLIRAAARREEKAFSWKLVKEGGNPWYEAVLSTPRQDWLRDWLARREHPVETLRRVGIGTLKLGGLPVGGYRHLTQAERNGLLAECTRWRQWSGMAKPPR